MKTGHSFISAQTAVDCVCVISPLNCVLADFPGFIFSQSESQSCSVSLLRVVLMDVGFVLSLELCLVLVNWCLFTV